DADFPDVPGGIVYISEDRKRDGLVLGMSVKENMSLTALRYFSRAGGSLKHKDEQQVRSVTVKPSRTSARLLRNTLVRLTWNMAKPCSEVIARWR
ncbi:hypothetical protein FK521_29780, partial [Klebsiella pneumoniae]|nr:hypothetical protein [Klebsiella pneumoniae]